ncbi:MAG: hypothetical protein KDE14_04390 [Rhodobacteraceae bacterium]|nr:hypothetical protein [Paracoccaceae bacterium]
MSATAGAQNNETTLAALSPEARALIEPALQAFKDIDRDMAALDPPQNDSERLIRLGRSDEAIRQAYAKIDFGLFAEDERVPAFDVVYAEIDKRDFQNQETLKILLPPEGWFLTNKYGAEAVEAAWLVVQHSVRMQPKLMSSALDAMERFLTSGQVDKNRYAMLYDRVAMMDGRYQKFGSQMICYRNRWVLYPVADLDTVDDRRREMGFEKTLSDNVSTFSARVCPADWTGKLPPGSQLPGPGQLH